MLKGACMTPESKYTCMISKDNNLNYSEWGGGAKYFILLQGEALQKIIEN